MTKSNSKIHFYIFKTLEGFCSISWRETSIISFSMPTKNKTKALEHIPGIEKKSSIPQAVKNAIEEIKNYFNGKNFNFSKIKLGFKDVPSFHKKVYKSLLKIKKDELVSYKDLAELSDSPNAARAVGQALKSNPIPLLIPCHRVIKSNGMIGNYSAEGGALRKIQMLKREGFSIENSKNPQLSRPILLTDLSISKAISKIINADKMFGKHIKKIGKCKLVVNNLQTPFLALLESIIYQQLTGKAAAKIFNRFAKTFSSNGLIRPFDIIRATDSEIKATGLSNNKVNAIRDLAEKTLAGEIPPMPKLIKMQNWEIIRQLTKIKGIGKWTVEMFLIFRLGRADVLANDDYGLKKGLAIAHNLDRLPSPCELANAGEAWRPYRSIASWYLWQLANNTQIKHSSD